MELDPASATAAIAAAADIALVLDRKGLVREVVVPDRILARSLDGHGAWPDRPWTATFAPGSQEAAAAMLEEALAGQPGPRRLLRHLSGGEAMVPVLYSALVLRGGRRLLALGRDLCGMDFTGLLLGRDPSLVTAYVAAQHARGMSPEAICLDLLAPAARRLGEAWAQDRCDVLEVSNGVFRMQQALAELGELAQARRPAPELAGRVLLATVPGEMHGMGIAMLAEFFRWAGWEVLVEAPDTPETLASLVRRTPLDLVGLSVGVAEHVEGVGALVRMIRSASLHRGLRVMVGGAGLLERPGLAAGLGADAVGMDARHAVIQARMLMDGGNRRSA